MEDSSPTAEVSKLHIRTHDRNDTVTPPWLNAEVNSESGIDKPMWVFGGDGDDDGKNTTPFSGGNAGACGVALQSDGKIVLAGSAVVEGDNDFALARYLSDGDLDDSGEDSFGIGGKVTLDVSGSYDAGHDGNDYIYGDFEPEHPLYDHEGGNDEIYGGNGDDQIWGGLRHDDIFGGAGDDQYPDYNDLEDWVDGLPSDKFPYVDLLTDMDYLVDDPEDWLGSDDNRDENGFYGGKHIYDYTTERRIRVEIDIEANGVNLDGYILRLFNSDESVIQVYATETGGQPMDLSGGWVIGTDPIPTEIWVQGVSAGFGGLTLAIVDPQTGEPLPGRPLPDYLMFSVHEPA